MFEKIFFAIYIALILVLGTTLILLNYSPTIKYAYIDSEGHLGLATICKKGKCETVDREVIPVKEFISTLK